MKYRVVEIYKRGEKIYKGKAHRIGWRVYKSHNKGEWVLDKFLPEGKA